MSSLRDLLQKELSIFNNMEIKIKICFKVSLLELKVINWILKSRVKNSDFVEKFQFANCFYKKNKIHFAFLLPITYTQNKVKETHFLLLTLESRCRIIKNHRHSYTYQVKVAHITADKLVIKKSNHIQNNSTKEHYN